MDAPRYAATRLWPEEPPRVVPELLRRLPLRELRGESGFGEVSPEQLIRELWAPLTGESHLAPDLREFGQLDRALGLGEWMPALRDEPLNTLQNLLSGILRAEMDGNVPAQAFGAAQLIRLISHLTPAQLGTRQMRYAAQAVTARYKDNIGTTDALLIDTLIPTTYLLNLAHRDPETAWDLLSRPLGEAAFDQIPHITDTLSEASLGLGPAPVLAAALAPRSARDIPGAHRRNFPHVTELAPEALRGLIAAGSWTQGRYHRSRHFQLPWETLATTEQASKTLNQNWHGPKTSLNYVCAALANPRTSKLGRQGAQVLLARSARIASSPGYMVIPTQGDQENRLNTPRGALEWCHDHGLPAHTLTESHLSALDHNLMVSYASLNLVLPGPHDDRPEVLAACAVMILSARTLALPGFETGLRELTEHDSTLRFNSKTLALLRHVASLTHISAEDASEAARAAEELSEWLEENDSA